MKTAVIFLMTALSGVLAGCSTPTKSFVVSSYDGKEVDICDTIRKIFIGSLG